MSNVSLFYELVRAGLWEKDVRLSTYDNIDLDEIYRLAEEQSVLGLAAAGIEHITGLSLPKEKVLTFAGTALQLEQANSAMNHFIAKLIEKMREEGIYTLLVKGQGVAQCYERPLWRACGDVDLLLSQDNYSKAKNFLIPLASSLEVENLSSSHLGMTIDSWIVELHGTLHSCCLSRMDKVIDEVQNSVFYGGEARSWVNGRTQVFLPSPDNDVIYIFTHIIKHFFDGGIGLRQICDWCRLMWTYQETINQQKLHKRLKKAGLLSEWRVFAALAVHYLGMPEEIIPFYSSEKKWLRKAKRLNKYIIRVGNFGHNRKEINSTQTSLLKQKISSFKLYTSDWYKQLAIFPLDSIRVWLWVMRTGISTMFNGKEDKRK